MMRYQVITWTWDEGHDERREFEPLHPHHQKTPESLMIWAFAFSKVPTEVPTFI